MALPFTHPEQARPPRTEEQSLASVHPIHPPAPEGVSLDDLYDPVAGEVEFDMHPRAIPGGMLRIGTYESERASRRIGLYEPDDHNPDLPTIVMHTPLGTSASGHNARVAGSFVQAGFKVELMGPPRYPGFTLRGMPLFEDANETLTMHHKLQETGDVPDHARIYVYGESQAAMKGLFTIALARKYGLEVEEAHIVAACFFDKINWLAVTRNVRGFTRMATGAIKAALELERAAFEELEGTIRHKDFHHHAVVIPVLTEGAPGQAIPLIDKLQPAHVTSFGRDVYSHPQKVRERFGNHPNIVVDVLRGRGHVDGILSRELADSRDVLLIQLAQKYR